MCWKYEEEYDTCLDIDILKPFDSPEDTGLLADLRWQHGIVVTNIDRFKELFFEMMSKAHEEKILKSA